MHIEMTLIFRM